MVLVPFMLGLNLVQDNLETKFLGPWKMDTLL